MLWMRLVIQQQQQAKAFAIGSAALTALALLASYIEEIKIALERIATASVDGLAKVGSEMLSIEAIKASTFENFMEYYNVTLNESNRFGWNIY